ncbi:MAG: GTP 3',8-cyclase MoaA [Acidimicrobiia bacterium]|nr:GTP 3',8-cyclase MoaA [Acidimicrobiia bacterium]MDH5521039.1 GTP 3',8-cyclase MoaA [Acidimicrobiia bacterium]
MTELVDRFGRIHTDLRISVTDRCNFRCQYCMPSEGMVWLDRSDVLTFEEIERIARLLVERAGVGSIRLTGGEPTVRAGLPLLVEKLAGLGVDLSMTTNGATLVRHAADLRAAGLRRLNISLDTLDSDRFVQLTRRNELDRVLAGIDAAVAAGFDPVKVNAVLMRGINDDEVIPFLEMGRAKGVIVRFIEFMPLDAQDEWSSDRVVTYDEILTTVTGHFDFEPISRGSSPAERFRYSDGGGEFGVIASVTEPFCGSCDRIRLTAEGQIRNCLFALEHVDLRVLLRGGASDDEILAAVAGEVDRKWAGHAIGQVHFLRPSKSMSQLGG